MWSHKLNHFHPRMGAWLVPVPASLYAVHLQHHRFFRSWQFSTISKNKVIKLARGLRRHKRVSSLEFFKKDVINCWTNGLYCWYKGGYNTQYYCLMSFYFILFPWLHFILRIQSYFSLLFLWWICSDIQLNFISRPRKQWIPPSYLFWTDLDTNNLWTLLWITLQLVNTRSWVLTSHSDSYILGCIWVICIFLCSQHNGTHSGMGKHGFSSLLKMRRLKPALVTR